MNPPDEFVALFERIREACDGDPSKLEPLARADARVSEMCNRLRALQRDVMTDVAPMARRQGFFRGDPRFREAWMAWTQAWEPAYLSAVLGDLLNDLLPDFEGAGGSRQTPPSPMSKPPERPAVFPPSPTLEGEAPDDIWPELPVWLEQAQDILGIRATSLEADDDPNAISYRSGEQALATLADSQGGWLAMRQRWAALEPVLVPHAIADHHGLTDRTSLLRMIEECRRAYLFNAPLGAVALGRVVMEIAVRDHWLRGDPIHEIGRRNGPGLERMLKRAQEKYPESVFDDQWKYLKDFSNDVMHTNKDKTYNLSKEVPRFLDFVRRLVETAPDGAPR